MRPVMHKLCTLRELKDGTYDLADIALMNDALEVQADNEHLQQQALSRK